jgi:hypothetical protein
MWFRRKPTEVNSNPMIAAVEYAVTKAVRLPKIVIGILAVVLALLIPVTVYTADQAIYHPLTNRVIQQDINSCIAGNAYRASLTTAWQDYQQLQGQEAKDTAGQLVSLIYALSNGNAAEIANINKILASSGKTDAVDQAAFLKKVEAINTPRNCQTAYGAQADNGS